MQSREFAETTTFRLGTYFLLSSSASWFTQALSGALVPTDSVRAQVLRVAKAIVQSTATGQIPLVASGTNYIAGLVELLALISWFLQSKLQDLVCLHHV